MTNRSVYCSIWEAILYIIVCRQIAPLVCRHLCTSGVKSPEASRTVMRLWEGSVTVLIALGWVRQCSSDRGSERSWLWSLCSLVGNFLQKLSSWWFFFFFGGWYASLVSMWSCHVARQPEGISFFVNHFFFISSTPHIKCRTEHLRQACPSWLQRVSAPTCSCRAWIVSESRRMCVSKG